MRAFLVGLLFLITLLIILALAVLLFPLVVVTGLILGIFALSPFALPASGSATPCDGNAKKKTASGDVTKCLPAEQAGTSCARSKGDKFRYHACVP